MLPKLVNAYDLRETQLVTVLYNGHAYRARITDIDWLESPPGEYKYSGTIELCLGAGHDCKLMGETVDVEPSAITELHDTRSHTSQTPYPAGYDWLAHARAACEFNDKSTGEAAWQHVLDAAHNWGDEAWLGGHDVPCASEPVTVTYVYDSELA